MMRCTFTLHRLLLWSSICNYVQFVEANEFDDASEYDDATSRLGSMSMSSAYSSDDDSPPFRSTGSPGRLTEVPASLLLPSCSSLRWAEHVQKAQPCPVNNFAQSMLGTCMRSWHQLSVAVVMLSCSRISHFTL